VISAIATAAKCKFECVCVSIKVIVHAFPRHCIILRVPKVIELCVCVDSKGNEKDISGTV
jgi:hypothetical protein